MHDWFSLWNCCLEMVVFVGEKWFVTIFFLKYMINVHLSLKKYQSLQYYFVNLNLCFDVFRLLKENSHFSLIFHVKIYIDLFEFLIFFFKNGKNFILQKSLKFQNLLKTVILVLFYIIMKITRSQVKILMHNVSWCRPIVSPLLEFFCWFC